MISTPYAPGTEVEKPGRVLSPGIAPFDIPAAGPPAVGHLRSRWAAG
jgi:hypothetical protein